MDTSTSIRGKSSSANTSRSSESRQVPDGASLDAACREQDQEGRTQRRVPGSGPSPRDEYAGLCRKRETRQRNDRAPRAPGAGLHVGETRKVKWNFHRKRCTPLSTLKRNCFREPRKSLDRKRRLSRIAGRDCRMATFSRNARGYSTAHSKAAVGVARSGLRCIKWRTLNSWSAKLPKRNRTNPRKRKWRSFFRASCAPSMPPTTAW